MGTSLKKFLAGLLAGILLGWTAMGAAQILPLGGGGGAGGGGGGAGTGLSYVTISAEGTLTAERVLTGTANQVTVTDDGANVTVTLSTPQNIHTAATPTFSDLTLSGHVASRIVVTGAGGTVDDAAALTNGQLLIGSTGLAPVAAAITGTLSQVTVTNGAGSITLSLPDPINVGTTGNAATATALAANPADCAVNQFANAIAASGALTCAAIADADVPDTITITLAATATALAANPTDCIATQFATAIAASGNLTCAALTDADVPNTITIDLAAAATALAANPTDCLANQFATAIAASGNLTCAAIVDADVPNTITIDLAAAATALAANPTDCAANQFATAIAASGNLTCAALVDADVPNTITLDNLTQITTRAISDTTGILATGRGGTGADFSATAQGSVWYFSGAGTVAALAVGTSGQALTTSGSAANPAWSGVNSYGSRGLVGANNSVTPNTQYDLDADVVILSTASTTSGTVVRVDPGAAITNNVLTAGPAANGRDQAAAFSASTWIHFYWIWNGTTLATVSSTVAPPTGPTLPTGYTHWAYAGVVRYDATPLLVRTRMLGSWMFYEAQVSVLSNGSATVETAIDLTAAVPPNANRAHLNAFALAADAVVGTRQLELRVISGSIFSYISFSQEVTLVESRQSYTLIIPNIAQNIYYIWTAAYTGRGLYIYVGGYAIPNGGE